MAIVTPVFPPIQHGHLSGPAEWLERFAAWRARQRERRQIIRDLSSHTDRQLADMGLTRDDIRAVARGAFRRGR